MDRNTSAAVSAICLRSAAVRRVLRAPRVHNMHCDMARRALRRADLALAAEDMAAADAAVREAEFHRQFFGA